MLKKASNILRRTTLKYMKDNPVKCHGSIGSEYGKIPNLLCTFLKCLIAGNLHLDGDVNGNVAILSMVIIV